MQLTISNVDYATIQYTGFCRSSGSLVRFSMKIDDFGFDFHKLSLSGIVNASWNITNAMVIWKQLHRKSC